MYGIKTTLKMNLNDAQKNCYTWKDFAQAIEMLQQEGLPSGYESGLKNFDRLCRFDKGRLVTVTGVPQSGKSMFIDFLCTCYHIKHGFKTLFYSTETPLAIHLNTLSRMFQKTADKDFGQYLFQNFQIIDETHEWNIDSLLEFAQEKLETFQFDVFVIDNYATLGYSKKGNLTEHEHISLVLDKLLKFAHKNNIMVILVAHPKKMEKNPDGGYQVPTAYDISGSSHFFNKSDFCITVHRLWRNQKPINVTQIICNKCKSQNYGNIGTAYLGFDCKTQNYVDIAFSDEEEPFDIPKEIKENLLKLDFHYELKKEKRHDFLETEINVFDRVSDTKPKVCTLKEVLFERQKSFKNQIEQVRRIEDKKERQEAKKNLLPCFSINCTFNGHRSSQDVYGITRLMYIDIDAQDNSKETMEKLPSFLESIDNVLYFQKSASGKGYMCIIPIDIVNAAEFESAWLGVQRAFEESGINIDGSTKDISRVTFFSYDENAYLNEDAIPYKPIQAAKVEQEKPHLNKTLPSLKREGHDEKENYKTVLQYIDKANAQKLDVAPAYNDYLRLGIACLASFGLEKSKEVFPTLCRYNETFNEEKALNDLEDWCNRYDKNYGCSFGSIKYLMDNAKPVS